MAGTRQIPAVVIVNRPSGWEVGTVAVVADDTRILLSVEVVQGDTGVGIVIQVR